MASLKTIEKKYFEELFDMQGGYVLYDSLTNVSFAQLFKDTVKIDIYNDKYAVHGNSKAKRLRAFWELESDVLVGTVLSELLEVWKFEQTKKNRTIETATYKECLKIVNRLLSKTDFNENTDDDFIAREFSNLNLTLLNIDIQFEKVIQQRIEEIEKSLKNRASLAVIFLCGSTLEGLLQDRASKQPREFNTAKSAPKKDGKVLPIHEWRLNSLIDVAYEIGIIDIDIKKFSHALRDFRNYIHPRQQAISQFNPDKHTAEISWKVLQATIASLSGQRNS